MKNAFVLSFCVFVLVSCSNDDNSCGNIPNLCDTKAIINEELYTNLETDFFYIDDLYIYENNLFVTLSASGCDGSTWDLDIIASEDVVEGFPPTRYIKFDFTNQEECLAVFQKQYCFDITDLQIADTQSLNLVFPQSGDDILYQYN